MSVWYTLISIVVFIRIASTKATVEYQKEAIRLLRENLRRNQQAQDTTSK